MTLINAALSYIDEVRNAFGYLKNHVPIAEDQETLELLGVSFLADEPTIFGEVNHDYVAREIAWYNSMSLNVYDLQTPIPKIWLQVATPRGRINSNYGNLLFSKDNHNQYENVLTQLQRYPDGRRATAIYTRPTMHEDWCREGMSDFVCTNAVNYFIRDQALHAIVQMRSNDAIFGYKNDLAWQRYVLKALHADLGRDDVEVGKIIWQAASLHIYRRHWDLITP